MLKSLGESEVHSIIEERGSVEVGCEYCGQSYDFDSVDVLQLFDSNHIVSTDLPGVQ